MKKILLLIALLFLTGIVSAANAAEEPVGFEINLDKIELSRNSSILEVTVKTDFRSPVRGLQGSVSYNKNVLSLKEAQNGEIILDGLTGNVESKREGKIDFSVVYADSYNQGGTLLKATFLLKPDNTYNKSEIRVKNIKIIDISNIKIDISDVYQYFNIDLPETESTSPATPPTDTRRSNSGSRSNSAEEVNIAAPGIESKNIFTDISGHWAAADIEYLYGLGIVSGVSEESFEPDRFITRAEFTKLISALLELKVAMPDIFSDVPENAWYKRYVMLAYTAEIVKGDGVLFRPEDNMTRAELAVITDRVLSYCNVIAPVETAAVYLDEKEIPSWAIGSVQRAAASGIMQGFDGKFDPEGNTTRAQTAAVIKRLRNVLNPKSTN